MKKILLILSLSLISPIIAEPVSYERITSFFIELEKKFPSLTNKTIEERREWLHAELKPLRDDIANSSLEAIQASKHPTKGITLLMFAIDFCDSKLITILLEKGVDINEEDRLGRSCINCAIFIPYDFFEQIVTLLLKHGANINHIDGSGNTLAHDIATLISHEKRQILHLPEDMQKKPEDMQKKLKFLEANGADFTIKNSYNMSVNDILNR